MSARRPLLLPLVPLYAAGMACKTRRFDKYRSLAKSLRDPVISVGSLSAGGAGKTPFLIALAGLVREIGYAPDVLSRGYGRSSRGVLRVDPHGRAETYGDEPLMLARMLGCPVYVGTERYEAGRAAEREGPDSGRRIHLLDDGFGHRRLARTVDIVLLTAQELEENLLPAGNLREPLTSLQRADILVLHASEEREVRSVAERYASSPARRPIFWTIERKLTLPSAMPLRPLVFSGIARPADFEAMLQRRGVEVASHVRFHDHHRYTQADIETLLRKSRAAGADGFLTTSKDAVKLDTAMREALGRAGALAVADAVVSFIERRTYAEDLRRLLRERTRLGTFVVGAEQTW